MEMNNRHPTSTLPEPDPAELEEFRQLVHEAGEVGSSAAAFSAQRLRVCVRAGEMMLRWKAAIPKGRWTQWIEQQVGSDAVTERTRQRWMHVALMNQQGKLDLETPRGLRHAYTLVQLLPEGGSSGTKQSSTKPLYMVHLNRLITCLETIDLESLSHEERQTMKERFAPLVRLVEKL